MAIPFYSQTDQDIYASGDKFIPQEQYRLNYAPPSIMGQNTNAGITSTDVAKPYIWPPKRSLAGGQEDLYQLPDYNPNQNLGPTNITDYEAEAADVGSTWAGSWAKLKDAYSKLPTPGNLIMKRVEKYKADKAAKEEEDEELAAQTRTRAINKMKEKYKDPNYIPITTGGGADIIPINGGTTDDGGVNGGTGHGDAGLAGGESETTLGSFAQGGRIGYRYGDPVIPEDETEDVFELMRDQNIPIGEQVEGDPFQMRIQELMGKGLSWDDAYDIAEMEFQDLFAEAPDSADEGLASLV